MAKSVKLKEPNTYIDASSVYNFESKMTQEEINALFTNDGAGTHNSIYRGKFLGTSVTPEQYAAIANGTFKGMYNGDFWTINEVNYRIGDFDYFLRSGDIECKNHHVLIVPDTSLYKAKMNTSNTTTGGYVGSAMYKSNLAQAKTMIKAAFGAEHIITHRDYLCNAVTNGKPSGGVWADLDVMLMSEQMAFGGTFIEPTSDGSTVPAKYTIACKQLNLFRHRPDLINNRMTYWLRNVVSSTTFAVASSSGEANAMVASTTLNVRPYFCIGVVEV